MRQVEMIELARMMAVKSHLSEDEAKKFVSAFFTSIQRALTTDKSVKIKGLGTFKIEQVKEMESVLLKTGETVMVDSFGKVVFTPENTLSESVNKPFAQFQEVRVNDGVVFDDIETYGEGDEPRQSADTYPMLNMRVVDVNAEDGNTPAVPQSMLTGESHAAAAEEKAAVRENGDDVDRVSKRPSWLKWAVALLLMVAVAGIAYFIGSSSKKQNEPTRVLATEEKVDTTTHEEVAAQVEQKADSDVDLAAANEAVKYGGYEIVGIDTTIVVGRGQTIPYISSAFMGSELMEMYIVAVNGGNKDVTEGQKLRLPKLRLKKH